MVCCDRASKRLRATRSDRPHLACWWWLGRLGGRHLSVRDEGMPIVRLRLAEDAGQLRRNRIAGTRPHSAGLAGPCGLACQHHRFSSHGVLSSFLLKD
jgi:hypothetical protein